MIKGSLVATENKSAAGSNNLLRGTMKLLFDAKLHQTMMSYYGVVTVTELDFGPSVLLTTAAIE